MTLSPAIDFLIRFAFVWAALVICWRAGKVDPPARWREVKAR